MLRFKEKKALMDLIDKFCWVKNVKGVSLYVFIDLWDFYDLSKYFREKHPSLFDNGGIEYHGKGSYICIPNFEDVLDSIGLSEEEVHEMFEE